MQIDRKSRCYQTLKSKILTLELMPGSALDESILSVEYGLSRTPFREVLQRLAGEGFVILEKHRGALVSSMNIDVMRNFFQAAPIIYASISRLAAENAAPDGIAQLRTIQEKFRRAVEGKSPSDMVLFNYQFHEMVGIISGNLYLEPSFNRLLIDHARTSQVFYRPLHREDLQRIALSCDQHDELIASIDRGDSAKAVEITLKHWDLSRHAMEIYVLPDPLPLDLAGTSLIGTADGGRR